MISFLNIEKGPATLEVVINLTSIALRMMEQKERRHRVQTESGISGEVTTDWRFVSVGSHLSGCLFRANIDLPDGTLKASFLLAEPIDPSRN